ncbi:Myeloid leukemia factor 2 [Lemmus lemmus]
MDMFGMMNDMIGNMEHMAVGGNCKAFSSSTVIYSNIGGGSPKVYQETSEMHSALGGIPETGRTVRDSDSGLEQISISHHIWNRAHILQRSQNHHRGYQEERQDYINLDESEATAFDDEWQRETSLFKQQCPLEFRWHEASAGGGRGGEGTRDPPAWLSSDLRTSPPDSPVAMTDEGLRLSVSFVQAERSSREITLSFPTSSQFNIKLTGQMAPTSPWGSQGGPFTAPYLLFPSYRPSP